MNLRKPCLVYTIPPLLPRLSPSWPPSWPSSLRRTYATIRDSQHDTPPWPSSPSPSPYDIFAISHADPYTKKRFYQLVKIYHPDLQTPISASLPATVRLERYRLIVAANDLLSDPAKRHAFDVHGLGWTGTSPASIRNADRAWRSRPGNAAANATWEDWEKWYEANGRSAPGKRQATVFMPNGSFAMLIAMVCIIGAMLQSQRAERSGSHYVETTNAHNQAVGQDVRKNTQLSAGMSQDERVGRFLRERENVHFQFAPGKFEAAQGEGEEKEKG